MLTYVHKLIGFDMDHNSSFRQNFLLKSFALKLFISSPRGCIGRHRRRNKIYNKNTYSSMNINSTVL